MFGDARFERLAGLSNGHLDNLRHSTPYRRRMGTQESTRPAGRPGCLRADTVHQGDPGKVKGVCHVNVADEVTQCECAGSAERIGERCLIPVRESLLEAFPFQALGFQSGNGSEYLNRRVAGLLEQLRAEEFAKSRPRRCNDNALAESKNGSVIRKHPGYGHIPARHAERLDAFNREVLSPCLNYHRPCRFPSEEVDAKGRVRERCRRRDIMTPCEKLKPLPGAEARAIFLGTIDSRSCVAGTCQVARKACAAERGAARSPQKRCRHGRPGFRRQGRRPGTQCPGRRHRGGAAGQRPALR